MRKLVALISNLKVAIVLLLLIATSSAIGTAIPQEENREIYLNAYRNKPWLGLLNGEKILFIGLDHVYTSYWFIGLLFLLGLSLLFCSWRRQWPSLVAAIKWKYYSTPKQISKLSIAETFECKDTEKSLSKLSIILHDWGTLLLNHFQITADLRFRQFFKTFVKFLENFIDMV